MLRHKKCWGEAKTLSPVLFRSLYLREIVTYFKTLKSHLHGCLLFINMETNKWNGDSLPLFIKET